MKRVLSIILAATMIVLMIPFSTIIASAEGQDALYTKVWDFTTLEPDDGADGDINPSLPTGVWATKDTSFGRTTAITADNGVALGGAHQAIGLEAGSVPAGDYVLEFTWNVRDDKIEWLAFGWGDSKTSNPGGESYPCLQVHGGKGAADAFGSSNGDLHWSWTKKAADGVDVASTFKALVNEGKDITISLEVKDGYVAEIHLSSESGEVATYTPPTATAHKAEGMFRVWTRDKGDEVLFNVKNITVISETDWEIEGEEAVVNPKHPYAKLWNFMNLTPDDGADGDINPSLPAGVWATKDTNFEKTTAITEDNGITLGGQQQAVGLEADATPAGDYIVEFTFNLKNGGVVEYLTFGWGDSKTVNPSAESSYLCLQIMGGDNRDEGKSTADLHWNWIKEAADGVADLKATFTSYVVNGNDMAVSLVVKDGYVAEVHLSAESGELATYYPPKADALKAEGMFRVWNRDWGTATQCNIKSLAVKSLAEGDGYTGAIAPVWNADKYDYFVDFTTLTPDDGADGDINPSLPVGAWATKDTEFNKVTAITADNGVALGGAHQAIGLEADVLPTGDYILEFTWNVRDDKIEWLAFGWCDSKTSNPGGESYPCLQVLGGKGAANAFGSSNGDLHWSWTKKAADGVNVASTFEGLVNEGKDIAISIVVKNGYVAEIHLSAESGEVATYTPPTATAHKAEGMFRVWTRDKGDSVLFNVKNIAVKSLADGEGYTGAIAPTWDVTEEEEKISIELKAGETSYRNEGGVEAIRFTTTFNDADMQKLMSLYEEGIITNVELGTLITTSSWADAAGAVTFEALDAIKGTKNAYVVAMATLDDLYAPNTIAGTITSVNPAREYHAAGFARITLATGEIVLVYSDVNTATLADVKPVA